MATIKATNNESVYRIEKFLGLNENPAGDTKLKLGEASRCQNWKITRDRNLQKRPGSKTIIDTFSKAPVQGMWFGNVKGTKVGLAASGNVMWLFYEGSDFLDTPQMLGTLSTRNRVNFFAYSNIVYILNGEDYYQYDGVSFGKVIGYRPLIVTSRTPTGDQSTLLEEVNKLNGYRRVWFSPNGTATTFQLPETDLVSVDYVKINATDEYVDPDTYSFNRQAGTVTFDTAPEQGVNTIEIGYQAAGTYRQDVCRMTNAELFLGAQDNAVFLYGNGTNEAVYSGIDYWGKPRADYFPDLNEMAVADSNTPITAMIRNYSQMICFKSNSAYSVHYGLITTATGDQEYAFYVTPINREIGNVALGQVRQVLNAPFTLFGHDLYEWRNTSSYSSNLTIDERQARRISDRIYATLETFESDKCYCYDDNRGQEYYICYGNEALVYNYPADAWYYYSGLNIHSMCNTDELLLFGTDDGRICSLAEEYLNDDGTVIDCVWESGSLDFGKNYLRKFMSEIWISVKPQAHSKVTVTVQTDKKSEFTEKVLESRLATFEHMDFEDFSFSTNRKPQVKKLKIKAKKFAFLKIIFKSKDLYTSAIVLSADPKIRETGYVK